MGFSRYFTRVILLCMKTIIGLVGEKFAGKDVVANYLEKKHGAKHVRFSHLLDEILNILNLPISRRNEIDLGLGLRHIFGRSVLGPAVVKRVLDASEELIVVNGIRMDEMEDIKKIGAKIIYITAPVNVRFERYQNRHEKQDDASMDLEHFISQEQEATEINIPALGKKADFKIENSGSLEELYEKVEKIIS